MTESAAALFEKSLRNQLLTGFAAPVYDVVRAAMRSAQAGEVVEITEPMPDDLVAAYNAQRETDDTSTLCHAAATTLYFGREGDVTACCYSRSDRYAHWPEISIADLWFGAERQVLCGRLASGVMPLSCSVCAEQLSARNFKGMLARNYDHLPAQAPAAAAVEATAKRYPISMEFELSNKCNLECVMCSGKFSSAIRANREHKPPMPMTYDARFVEQLREFIPYLRQAKFYGGEPFLIDLYYEIWELFLELNPTCQITITTNGTAVSPKILRLLERLNFNIVVSLDGFTKDTYEAIRVNATHARVMANIATFQDILRQRGRGLYIAICPMATNWRELPQLVGFANEIGAPVSFNTVFFPEELSIRRMPGSEKAEVAAFLRASIGNAADDVAARNFAAVADLCRQIDAWIADSRLDG